MRQKNCSTISSKRYQARILLVYFLCLFNEYLDLNPDYSFYSEFRYIFVENIKKRVYIWKTYIFLLKKIFNVPLQLKKHYCIQILLSRRLPCGHLKIRVTFKRLNVCKKNPKNLI